ncbi:hypothetical protein CsSME_00022325 [Camellia sinensis var. sinensis]
MSDDDDDQGADILGFGPLVPTESERSLMERGYKEKIVDIREEILRKRRAGKLPGDTTSMLKAWWQSHSKWSYPTVKALMGKHEAPTNHEGRQGKIGPGNRVAIETDK